MAPQGFWGSGEERVRVSFPSFLKNFEALVRRPEESPCCFCISLPDAPRRFSSSKADFREVKARFDLLSSSSNPKAVTIHFERPKVPCVLSLAVFLGFLELQGSRS